MIYLLLLSSGVWGGVASAKESYEGLVVQSKQSMCLRSAFQQLETTLCKDMDEDVQASIALEMANCHLKRSKRSTYNQSHDMDSDGWNTYTTFFTHVQQSCFFLQGQAWQERTDNLIKNLENTSEHLLTDLGKNLQHTEALRETTTQVYEKSTEALEVSV